MKKSQVVSHFSKAKSNWVNNVPPNKNNSPTELKIHGNLQIEVWKLLLVISILIAWASFIFTR